jgi:hypothetical protein
MRDPESIYVLTVSIADHWFEGTSNKDFDMRDICSTLYGLTNETSALVKENS